MPLGTAGGSFRLGARGWAGPEPGLSRASATAVLSGRGGIHVAGHFGTC